MAIELVEEELPTYITNVLLLCAECKQPIKARINTASWIRVEWISPDGTCQSCWNTAKETTDATNCKDDCHYVEEGG